LRASHLTGDDQATIDEMRSHPVGKLAYLACSTATAIELSTSWRHDIFDDKMIRVDLDAEVAEISRSCARLRTSVEKLGPRPPADLEDDPDIVAIHAGRTEIHDERLGLLTARLQAFARYRAGIEQVDKQLAKLEWVIKVGTDDDSDEFVAAAADELGSERLNRAAEEFDSVSGAIIDSMLTDAKKLSRIVRYS
jgi:phosphoglycerate dehydrogenase-like enzyme